VGKPIIRRAFKTVMLVVNAIIILFYLLACLSAYLNPSNWWIISLIGLTFPYLVITLFLLAIFWLIAKPKLAWVSLIVLLVGWKQFSVYFATKSTPLFSMSKSNHSIRIVNWNVQSFNGLTSSKSAKKLIRTDIENSINTYQPDVVCLQEFNTSGNNSDASDNIALFSKNYPYHFFSEDYQRVKGKYKSGCIIFSKIPIIATGKIKFPVAESLIYADILKDSDTIRIYTTHLQSFKFKKEDYDGIDNLGNTNDEAIIASKNIVKKMKLAFTRRSKQVELVKESINQSPYPNILCGDFNDVPYSYTYFMLKENRKDAFLEKQFGIGKTFIGLAYSLRIDYILPDNHFNVQQFDLIDENLSDHLMLVSDIELISKNK